MSIGLRLGTGLGLSMPLKFELRINDADFTRAITKEIHEKISIRISQLIAIIRPDVIDFIADQLRNDPNGTYYELQNGKLNADFGFEAGTFPAEEIVQQIANSVSLTKLRPTSTSAGGVRLEILKGGIEFLLNDGVASYESTGLAGGEVNWLSWLLTAGQEIVVADYYVLYKLNEPASRSKLGIMVPSIKGGWRLDPFHSGTIENNWITRAFVKAESRISIKLEKGFKQVWNR